MDTSAHKALLLGSIGVIAETSELQRRAFNLAFEEAGLDWSWSEGTYRDLLQKPGGQARIADYAAERGEEVDAAAVHAAKVDHFEKLVVDDGIEPRAGLVETLSQAHADGLKLGWATSTTERTVELMLAGLFPTIPRSVFDFIGDASQVKHSKPAPDIYHAALEALNVRADEAIAIEDTPEAAEAALAAGLTTFAYPNEMAQTRKFPDGVIRLRSLTPDAIFGTKQAA